MKDFKDINVAVAGTGYVGLSIAEVFSREAIELDCYSRWQDCL